KFAFGSNRRNGRDTDWYVSDARRPTDEPPVLKADNDFWNASDWSQDGGRLLIQKFVSANESYPALIDVATKKLTMLPLAGGSAASDSKPPAPASYSDLRFTPDGKSVYIATDALAESAQLMRLDLESGKYTRLVDPSPWEIEQVRVEPTTGTVA